MTVPLSRDEKEYAFLVATKFFDERHGEAACDGMTDQQLAEALRDGLSRRLIWGGPGRLSGQCDPVGLKIFADRSPSEVSSKPIFADQQTLAMARELYGIRDPNELQLTMF